MINIMGKLNIDMDTRYCSVVGAVPFWINYVNWSVIYDRKYNRIKEFAIYTE